MGIANQSTRSEEIKSQLLWLWSAGRLDLADAELP